MPTPIALSDLSAATVHYNGVVFGGSSLNTYTSTPPVYHFRGQFIYDEAGRAVVGTKYTLVVNTVFTNLDDTAESIHPDFAQNLRDRLSAPRGDLAIYGLGTAFEDIIIDEDWGPKPVGFDWKPLGPYSWEMTWAVEFVLKDCPNARNNYNHRNFVAFNFTTSWQNDFEGLTTRTISGYAQIAAVGTAKNKDIPIVSAETARSSLNVICPPGFKRISNNWVENAAKNRLDFSIVDTTISGEALPVGCTAAKAEFGYASSQQGFGRGVATLSMMIKVAPGVSPRYGGILFLAACKTKQRALEMGTKMSSSDNTVLPVHISIRHLKYDESRVTIGSMSWGTTGNLQTIMAGAGIWQPLTPDDDAKWRNSMVAVWGNRGVVRVGGSPIMSDPQEGVIIDLCDQVSSATIGAIGQPVVKVPEHAPDLSLAEPYIPQNAGYMGYEVKVEILRQEGNTGHKKSYSYDPKQSQESSRPRNQKAEPESSIQLNVPGVTQTSEQEHVYEYHGYPVTRVAIRYKALRAKYFPDPPMIRTVNGRKAVLEISNPSAPQPVFNAGVPVYYIDGVDVYVIPGVIKEIKPSNSVIIAGTKRINPEIM